MNHAIAGNLPAHIKFIREGKRVWQRSDNNDWDLAFDSISVSGAKNYVRTKLGCKGGPKSAVRTAQSVGVAG